MSEKEKAESMEIHPVAHIHTDFPAKFGIPRQSGLVEELEGLIVMEPAFRSPEAFRGIEGFTHLWLIWQFSENVRESWSPTVRPPRLGGNVRMGVFATRSPFRPNALGLSCVKLLGWERNEKLGPILRVAGADLMDGTPIFDIKPYTPLADCHPEAQGGFTEINTDYILEVEIPEPWLSLVPEEKREALRGVLSQDPRPSYQRDSSRIYGMSFAGLEVRFRVEEKRLTVCEIQIVKKLKTKYEQNEKTDLKNFFEKN